MVHTVAALIALAHLTNAMPNYLELTDISHASLLAPSMQAYKWQDNSDIGVIRIPLGQSHISIYVEEDGSALYMVLFLVDEISVIYPVDSATINLQALDYRTPLQRWITD